jgi:hypothetical protein
VSGYVGFLLIVDIIAKASLANIIGSNSRFSINKVTAVASSVKISTAMKTEIGSNTSFPPKARYRISPISGI